MDRAATGLPVAHRPVWSEVWWWLLGSLAFAGWLIWGPARIMDGMDYALMHHFFKVHLREAFWAGEVPFWNPYTLLGRPFLADPEVAAFYPPTWLFLFLPEEVACWLVTGLHLALGGSGFAVLARRWGAAPFAAVAAGLVFVVSPPFLGHLQGGLLGFACTIAWWPWLIDRTDRLCESPTVSTVLSLAALLAGCFLAGHIHAFWLCGCSLGFYILPRCFHGAPAGALMRAVRAYGALALAAVVALALCAIEFLPLLELAGQSNRSAGREFASAVSLAFGGVSSLWNPVPAGGIGDWEGTFYVGLPVLLLGVGQLFRVFDPRMRALVVVGVVGLALALGRQTALFDLLFPLVPAMGYFRCNNRFGMFLVWVVILAAAVFWRRRDKYLSASDAGVVAGVVVATVMARVVGLGVAWAILAGVAGGVCGVVLARCGLRLGVRCWFGLWAACWLVDFVPASLVVGREIQARTAIPYAADAEFPSEIEREIGPPRELAPPRYFLPQTVLRANSGMVNGYSSMIGYGALTSARVWDYLHLGAGVQPSQYLNTYPSSAIFTRRGPFPYRGANILLGWDASAQQLLLCPPALLGSRVWLTGSTTAVENEAAALEALVAGFDPRTGALVEPDAQPLVAGCTRGSVGGTAHITAFARNRIAMSVVADSPAVLVVAEAWYPGWRARIDGRDSEVFPVNLWMRGVVVPEGTHEVVLVYRPTYFLGGAAISFLAFVGWLIVWRRTPPSMPVVG